MPKFIHDSYTLEQANVIALGVPIGRWSREALESLRKTNWFVEFFDIDREKNLLENVRVFDKGDLEISDYQQLSKVTDAVREILNERKIPLVLGGGHLLTLYSFQAFDKNTKLIVFDAHCDLKDEFIDEKMLDLDFISDDAKLNPKVNDVTWLRRLCEKINPKNVMQIGLRSGDEQEIDFLKESGIKYYTSNEVRGHLNKIKNEVRKFTKNFNVYISLDVDVFDPSIAPAVDHPEPNGLLFREFQELVSSISGKLVGMDLVCLKPIKDNQVTEFTAVRATFEILGKIG
jgi:agmatinase